MGTAMSYDLITRTVLGKNPKTVPFRDRLARALAGVPAKIIANSVGVTEKAAERWKAGDNAPSAEVLARLCGEFDTVWAEFREHSCRSEADAERILADFAARLAERRRDAAPQP